MPTYGAGQPLLHARRNAFTEADRKCRDVLCILLFLLLWVGMAFVAAVAYQNGSPGALIYPVDHTGNLCNATYPDMYYPHPQADASANVPYYGICLAQCPMKGDVVEGRAANVSFEPLLHRCMPKNITDASTKSAYEGVFGDASTAFKYLSRYIHDLQVTYKAILGIGAAGGFMGCLFWLALLRSVPHLIVWASILAVLLALLVCTAVCASEANLVQNGQISALASSIRIETNASHNAYFKVATIVLLVIDIGYVLVLAFLRSRIQLSIGIIKVACTGLSHIPMLLFFPIVPALKLLGLFAYFVVSSVYIASCGNLSAAQLKATMHGPRYADTSSNATDPNLMKYLFAYNIFGIFWTQQLIEAIAVCTISGAICRYYWCDNDRRHDLGWAVGASAYYSVRYHFGTLVFGAGILAVVQFLRVLLEYIDRQTQGTQNKAVQIVVCCCRCCLYCLHKVVKFLSSNGYILVAMKGGSFCHAIVDAFNLVAANLGRIGTQSIVATYVLFMGKLLITAVCVLGMYAFEASHASLHLTSPFPPLIATGLLAYAISCLFLGVFDVAIHTVLLSVCEDEKINRSTGQYYATPEVRSFLDDSAKFAFKHHLPDGQDASV